MSERTHWWKEVPCHFIWNLEENAPGSDYKTLVSSLDSKLSTHDDVPWKGSICDMLLFRGYVEVSKFDGVKPNSGKALEYFLKAEEEAVEVPDDDERRAYRTVSSANRLWVLRADVSTEKERNGILASLEESWLECRTEKLDAYLHAIKGCALTRLGPNKCRAAEKEYRKAIKIISTKGSWYHTMGVLIRRQAGEKTRTLHFRYEDMNDEVSCYEKAIELDPTHDAARCDLALALIKISDRKEEAFQLIEAAQEKSCQVIIAKGRFYRLQKDYMKALEVLQKGETLPYPRSDIFFQISLIYSTLAKQSNNFNKRQEYKEKEMEYIEKCLSHEPSHFYALLHKAFGLGKAGKHEEAEDMFRKIIDDFKDCPRDHITAKAKYAHSLLDTNRYRMTDQTANAFEDVVDTAMAIHKSIGLDENFNITGDFGCLTYAARNLRNYYSKQKDRPKFNALKSKLREMGQEE